LLILLGTKYGNQRSQFESHSHHLVVSLTQHTKVYHYYYQFRFISANCESDYHYCHRNCHQYSGLLVLCDEFYRLFYCLSYFLNSKEQPLRHSHGFLWMCFFHCSFLSIFQLDFIKIAHLHLPFSPPSRVFRFFYSLELYFEIPAI